MKTFLLILALIIPGRLLASAYIGLQYGYSAFTSPETKKYELNQKGPAYGGFLGIGKEFVGIEGYYSKFSTEGKIKHDGQSYDFNSGASGLGAALRFSFQFFYLRLGAGSYTLEQDIAADDSTTQRAINEIYNVQDGTRKNGILLGIGLHRRLGNTAVFFLDFSRHQIAGVGNYDALSLGLSFNIPDKLFDLGRF